MDRSKSAAAPDYYETDASADEDSRRSLDPTDSAFQSLRIPTVRDIMTREVISVSGGQSVAGVAELMRDRPVHRVLVVEDGKLLSMVCSLDIVSAVADRA